MQEGRGSEAALSTAFAAALRGSGLRCRVVNDISASIYEALALAQGHTHAPHGEIAQRQTYAPQGETAQGPVEETCIMVGDFDGLSTNEENGNLGLGMEKEKIVLEKESPRSPKKRHTANIKGLSIVDSPSLTEGGEGSMGAGDGTCWWVEVWDSDARFWVHCDACLGLVDEPLSVEAAKGVCLSLDVQK